MLLFVLPTFSAPAREQMPGQKPCHQLCPAQSPNPRGSPELRGKVSSLETGNSIRVTPTCKTETIALTRLGFRSHWRQLHFSGPAYGGRLLLPRIRQHNICFFQSLVKDRTGKAHLEALSEGSPHVLPCDGWGMLGFISGLSGLMQPRDTLVISKHWEENQNNTLNEITLFIPLSKSSAPVPPGFSADCSVRTH